MVQCGGEAGSGVEFVGDYAGVMVCLVYRAEYNMQSCTSRICFGQIQ